MDSDLREQILADELKLQSELTFKLLRQADEKILKSARTVMSLRKANKKLQHKLELQSTAQSRNNEQHSLAVQALKHEWAAERLMYQQQLEEMQRKVVDQNDRDRRRWARKSFSLPQSEEDNIKTITTSTTIRSSHMNTHTHTHTNTNTNTNTNTAIKLDGASVDNVRLSTLHPSVSFDAWGSEDSTGGGGRSSQTSFDDAWASGESGDGDVNSAASSSIDEDGVAASSRSTRTKDGIPTNSDSQSNIRTIQTEQEATSKRRKMLLMASERNNTTKKTSSITATATLPVPTIPTTTLTTLATTAATTTSAQQQQQQQQATGRPRFYSATEEEEEGATVILLDSMIQSPDFSYFDNHKDGSGRKNLPVAQIAPLIRRPVSAPPTAEDSTTMIAQHSSRSSRSTHTIQPARTNTTNTTKKTTNTQSRRPKTSTWDTNHTGSTTSGSNQDASLSLGDDNKSLLLRLLLAPEMMLVSAILAAVPPRSKALLQNPLMRLFASHGKVARLLQWSIDLEVSGTQSPTTLFRSDSYASRMLSTFTKNVGGAYLRHVLSPTLRIVADNADSLHRHRVSTFEVRQQTIDDFGGASNTGAKNLTKLIAQVDCVLESVSRAERKLPQSFRHLCRYLFGAVTSRFQDSGHNAVGALLFLRFLCPALAAPEAFGIAMPRSRSSSPAFVTRGPGGIVMVSPAERRSKVLITKLLQKVVSGIPFSEREPEMQAANSFILEKHDEVKRMLTRVCVPDVVAGASMETAVSHDWARHQQQGLKTNEAMRTVRSLLVQNFDRIDDELPPVAFVLRRQFREALQAENGGRGGSSRRGTRRKGQGGNGRVSSDVLEFVNKDLGL